MLKRTLIPAAVVLLMLFAQSFAQVGGRLKRIHEFQGLDLTEEQQVQIEQINTDAMKAHLPIRSKLQTLNAELDEILIADNPNRGAINRKIDEMSSLRTEMQKDRIDTRLKIRELLTEEQRVKFDAIRMHGPGKRMMRHFGRGLRGGMRGGRPGMGRPMMGRFGDLPAEIHEEEGGAEF